MLSGFIFEIICVHSLCRYVMYYSTEGNGRKSRLMTLVIKNHINNNCATNMLISMCFKVVLFMLHFLVPFVIRSAIPMLMLV